ncbi:MAG: hypothetical protein JO306_17390, partial [Gemmatimonadetes bacterium]|nr:hypothetical protein [Gemmatimonadota bacterium]
MEAVMSVIDGTIVDKGGEVFNVMHPDFGAAGDGIINDTPAIQKAIDTATMDPLARGGVVYFPPGEYRIKHPGLVLPRGKIVALVGAGPTVTSLHASPGLLGRDEPLLRWDGVKGKPTPFFRLQGIQLSRSDDGPVLTYAKPRSEQVHERLVHAVFEDVYFRAATAGAGSLNGDTVVLDGLLNCALRDVAIHGGNVGLVLQESSHCVIENFRTDDRSLNLAIRVIGGGNHVFVNTRIESTMGLSGIQVESGAANLLFDGLYFEGKKTSPQINILDAHGVTILSPALATPTVSGAFGLHVSARATNVRVIGGLAKDFLGEPGCKAIKVDSGARYVNVENMAFMGPPEAAALNVDIASGANTTSVELLCGSPFSKRFVVTSALPMLAANTATPSVSEGDTYLVANTAATAITNLLDGYAGK